MATRRTRNTSFDDIAPGHDKLVAQVAELTAQVAAMQAQLVAPSSPSLARSPRDRDERVRLKTSHFPTFDGSTDVEAWIGAVTFVTQHAGVTQDCIVQFLPRLLLGEAGKWFMFEPHPSLLTTWPQWADHLRERFRPPGYIAQAELELQSRSLQRGETLCAFFDDIVRLARIVHGVGVTAAVVVRYALRRLPGEVLGCVRAVVREGGTLSAVRSELSEWEHLRLARSRDGVRRLHNPPPGEYAVHPPVKSWRCSVCGGAHRVRDCPQRSAPSVSAMVPRGGCFICSGEHFARNCPRRQQPVAVNAVLRDPHGDLWDRAPPAPPSGPPLATDVVNEVAPAVTQDFRTPHRP